MHGWQNKGPLCLVFRIAGRLDPGSAGVRKCVEVAGLEGGSRWVPPKSLVLFLDCGYLLGTVEGSEAMTPVSCVSGPNQTGGSVGCRQQDEGEGWG
jgi:hypothetical protein